MADHGSGIRVVPGQLRVVADAVDRNGESLGSAARAVGTMPDLSPTTPLGPALADFRTAWATLIGIAADDAARCGRALRTAATEWEATDAGVGHTIAASSGRVPT